MVRSYIINEFSIIIDLINIIQKNKSENIYKVLRPNEKYDCNHIRKVSNTVKPRDALSQFTVPDVPCPYLPYHDLPCPDIPCPDLACLDLACPDLPCLDLACPNLPVFR